MRPQNRKINRKGRPAQTKNYNCVHLSNKCIQILNRGGPHMRSLISIAFPAPEMELESAHMWYQLSPFPSSNAAIAMQHHPGNIHQSFATPRYSATPCYVLIQSPNVIDTMSKRWRSKKAFNTSPCHIFS